MMHLPDSPRLAVGLVLGLLTFIAGRSHHHVTDSADIFTFPRAIGYLFSAVALLTFVVPFIVREPGDLNVQLMLIAMALLFFTGAMHFFRYRVIVTDESVTIGSFRRRVILCDSIVDWDLIRGSRSSELLVYLKNGEKLRLSGLIGDFDELVGMINSHEAIPPRGHPDSAEKLRDRQAREQAQRRGNVIVVAGLIIIGIVLVALWKVRLLN
jgi:hypothetical protein